MATAGVVALGPSLVNQPMLALAQPQIPVVQIHEVQLAGIGQDIYQAINAWVEYGVELVQYGVSLIPFIGGPLSAQIDIIYFDTIQPAVEDTVNFLASIVQNPFNLVGETSQYLGQLYGLAYNFVASELAFFGFPILPPLPPLAASAAPEGGLVGALRSAEPTTVEELAAEFGAEEIVALEVVPAEVVPAEIAAPIGVVSEIVAETTAVPEIVEVPAMSPAAAPLVEPALRAEIATVPDVEELPDVAPVVESATVPPVDPTVGAPVKVAAAPARSAARMVDRSARAASGEVRNSGKAPRVGRGTAE